MLKCSCNPSAAAGGMDKVCCAPLRTTLPVKNVRFEENGRKITKKPPRDSATSGSPKNCRHPSNPQIFCLFFHVDFLFTGRPKAVIVVEILPNVRYLWLYQCASDCDYAGEKPHQFCRVKSIGPLSSEKPQSPAEPRRDPRRGL